MANVINLVYGFELVSIQISLQNIRLELGPPESGLAIEFNGSFDIIRADSSGVIETINAWERLGDIRVIWPLIGLEMSKIIMDDKSFRLMFKDGTVLQSKNGPFPEIVNVWGPMGDKDKIYLTSYPAVLNDN